ncbi:MAG: hypothetical protein JSR91_03805 [Proteobacteria bacterium]|nr:hypothetical protein [Pseudomonadota bacterium]
MDARLSLNAVAVLCALFGSGCASITSGKEQSLRFETDPVGADCTLVQDKVEIARFQTPKTIVLRRAKTPIMMTCVKPGFHQERALIANTTSRALWGNMIVGGIIGVMADQTSGAAFRYYDPPKFNLVPASESAPQVSQAVAQGITVLPPTESAESTSQVTLTSIRESRTKNDHDSQKKVEATTPSTSSQPMLVEAGAWTCRIKNIGNTARPHYTLQFVVGSDRTIRIVNYANARAVILKNTPLTFTAINPRGSRLTTFTWMPDNSMTITGPSINDPTLPFYNEGICEKA